MSANGLQTSSDRKVRAPSPHGSGSSRGDVVDHTAPNGERFFEFYMRPGNLLDFAQVTDEQPARARGPGASHLINVQPLKRSEMQVSERDSLPLDCANGYYSHHMLKILEQARYVKCGWQICANSNAAFCRSPTVFMVLCCKFLATASDCAVPSHAALAPILSAMSSKALWVLLLVSGNSTSPWTRASFKSTYARKA